MRQAPTASSHRAIKWQASLAESPPYAMILVLIVVKKRAVKQRSSSLSTAAVSDSGSRRGESMARQMEETTMAAITVRSKYGLLATHVC